MQYIPTIGPEPVVVVVGSNQNNKRCSRWCVATFFRLLAPFFVGVLCGACTVDLRIQGLLFVSCTEPSKRSVVTAERTSTPNEFVTKLTLSEPPAETPAKDTRIHSGSYTVVPPIWTPTIGDIEVHIIPCRWKSPPNDLSAHSVVVNYDVELGLGLGPEWSTGLRPQCATSPALDRRQTTFARSPVDAIWPAGLAPAQITFASHPLRTRPC